MTGPTTFPIHPKLVNALYVEAMILADEARGYFDQMGRTDRDLLGALDRVAFSCESLKVTTRLMHIIAWLLTQRAVDAGEIAPDDALSPARRLGTAPDTDPDVLAGMPGQAAAIIGASIDLYRRIARLDSAFGAQAVAFSPARRMLDRLSNAF